MVFRVDMGKPLHLNPPVTFNEKLQWLKLYNRNPEYTKMVDKYEVRKIVEEKIGAQYLIPLLGVWNSADEIDFDSLPSQFVLKCTHDSGSVIVCKDKASLDIPAIREKLKKSLRRKYYYFGREWPYKNVPHKVVAEQFILDGKGLATLTDYKFYCFNGVVDSVMLCLDRDTGDTKFYFFDENWNLRRYNLRGKAAPEGFTLPKPKGMDRMFEIARILSKGIPYVRVDLYNCDGDIFFGELTLFPQSGFDPNYLLETDKYFGQLIKLENMP
ncbi:ATP-grasp fold amidoligase family protein [Acetanaerobacterium elongatum]|uniref:ATP-grasp fold amidoligase family protein n=1 Tax=Acetanaerobacterium elongatum TaxID=258515 RepID=UPI001FA80120|nr:ATP-grasp fold amidoligase family protein [Acetanaerobacterium elongatum]